MNNAPILYYDETWPEVDYTGIPESNYMIPHLGQRKLLINEVAFLQLYKNRSKQVVYVGAAPGPHIVVLANLFPDNKFYLYDPRPFDENLKKQKNVKCFQQYFTDKNAIKYSKCLFISDIRTSGTDHEQEVLANLDQQKKWCELINPVMASLKFRMPYTKQNTKVEYYTGKIALQCWEKIESNETRLWTDCSKQKIYNSHEFEKRMFHYNLNLRLGDYDVGQLKYPGMDSCNDCAIEWCTWKSLGDPEKLIKLYSQSFDKPPHGMCSHLTASERKIKLASETKKFYERYHNNEKKIKLLNDITPRKN